MTDRLLTPRQAGEVLGVSPATLATWRWRGVPRLPYVRVGRLIRYRPSDITAFLETQTRTSTSDRCEVAP
jgi:predicted site-specific integrase-resolvase